MRQTLGPIQRQLPQGAENYPFTDAAKMKSRSNVFIPPTAFKDARLYPIEGEKDQHISRIRFSFSQISITVSDTSGEIGFCTITDFSEQVWPVLDAYGRDVGVLVLDPLNLKSSAGTNADLKFDKDAMPFCPTTMFPQPQKTVNALVDPSGKIAYGDVWLVGENGVVLEYDGGTNAITFNITSDPLFVRRFCENEGLAFTVQRPLKQLVIDDGTPFTVTPDAYGNVQFRLDNSNSTIVRLIPLPGGLRISVVGAQV